MHARKLSVALAIGLISSVPGALGQKMYKCSDGKGGTVFQQMKCEDTPEEIAARKKEQERAVAEALRLKEEEARKKQESMERAKERDKAYQEQLKQREEEQQKSKATEQRLMQGTTKEAGAVDDGTLPPGFEVSHPGAWRQVAHPDITAALEKNKTPGCGQYRYRQRANGLPEFVVQCTVDKANWVTYFVWPRSEVVKGPAKF